MQFKSKNISLSKNQKEYLTEKINSVLRKGAILQDPSTDIVADIAETSNKDIAKRISAQITIFVPHSIIRAETCASTFEEAVDICEQKLVKQVDRYVGKLKYRSSRGDWIPYEEAEDNNLFDDLAEEELRNIPRIVKRKRFNLKKPRHEQDAIEQMELIGHDFYLFLNKDTNRFSVVYKRHDGNYGIIEPHTGPEARS